MLKTSCVLALVGALWCGLAPGARAQDFDALHPPRGLTTVAEARELFAEKALALGWTTPLPGNASPTMTYGTQTAVYYRRALGENGYVGFYQKFPQGTLYGDRMHAQVFAVSEPMMGAWGRSGWEGGPLGFPLSDLETAFAPFSKIQFFEGGVVLVTSDNKTVEVQRSRFVSEPGGDIVEAITRTNRQAPFEPRLNIQPGGGIGSALQRVIRGEELGGSLSTEVGVRTTVDALRNDRAHFFQRGFAYWSAATRQVHFVLLPRSVRLFPARSGSWKVSIHSFRANKETSDDVLEGDGRRDEIQVGGVLRTFYKGRLVQGSIGRSAVFGDANRFSVRAGSGGDAGGVRTGDLVSNIPEQLPFELGVMNLKQGESAVQLVPMVWECDSPAQRRSLGLESSVFGAPLDLPGALHIAATEPNTAPELVPTPGSSAFARPAEVERTLWRRLTRGPDMNINAGAPGTRPIGWVWGDESYVFNPRGALFDYDLAEAVANTDFGFGRGLVPLTYTDDARLGGGSYTLYIQIQAA